MKKAFSLFFSVILLSLGVMSFASSDIKAVKCLIQLTNYTGEGAYVVVSLLNPQGQYEETLYVQGKDSEWYSEMAEWWKFYGKYRPSLDGITGATVSGGERTVTVLKIASSKIDKGYSLRFESSVEDQGYVKDDIQFDLTTENMQSTQDGKAFIRYVRMIAQ